MYLHSPSLLSSQVSSPSVNLQCTYLTRDYEVRERIPVPHDNYFQSFFSSRNAILENYNPPLSLKVNDVTLTDQ